MKNTIASSRRGGRSEAVGGDCTGAPIAGFCTKQGHLSTRVKARSAPARQGSPGQAELGDPVADFTAGDPEHGRRLGLIAAGLQQHPLEQEPFELVDHFGIQVFGTFLNPPFDEVLQVIE